VRNAPLLVAEEVRERLRAAVTPFVDAVVGRLDSTSQAFARGHAVAEAGGQTFTGRMGVLVQLHPLLLRVVLYGLPHAVELERFGGDEVTGLAEVVDDVLAGAMAGLQERDADQVLTAATRDRELLVGMNLENGDVKVMVAKRGQDLSRGVVVGAIVTEPVTTH
jgi:hypothetical protein